MIVFRAFLRSTLLLVAAMPLFAFGQSASNSNEILVEGAIVLVENTGTRISPTDINESGEVVLPRLNAVLKSITWQDSAGRDLELQAGTLALKSEPKSWRIVWKSAPQNAHSIYCQWDSEPRLFQDIGPVSPDASQRFRLLAKDAEVKGSSLRYEPQSFKNTVGYWTKQDDTATWRIEVEQGGTYHFAGLIGCGENQGGSQALVQVDAIDKSTSTNNPALVFEVAETGHFQNFRWQPIGQLQLEVGTYEVTVGAKQIAKGALMDLRELSVVRQAK